MPFLEQSMPSINVTITFYFFPPDLACNSWDFPLLKLNAVPFHCYKTILDILCQPKINMKFPRKNITAGSLEFLSPFIFTTHVQFVSTMKTARSMC